MLLLAAPAALADCRGQISDPSGGAAAGVGGAAVPPPGPHPPPTTSAAQMMVDAAMQAANPDPVTKARTYFPSQDVALTPKPISPPTGHQLDGPAKNPF